MNRIIIFDLLCSQPFGSIKFHGGGEYTKVVFKEVADILSNYCNVTMIACYNRNLYIDDWIVDLINKNRISPYYVNNYNEIVDLANEKSIDNDVTFYTGLANQYPHARFSNSVYKIGTCHGLRSIEKDYDPTMFMYSKNIKTVLQFFYFTLFRKRIFRNNKISYGRFLNVFDTIVTVSNHSRYAIKINYPEIISCKDLRTYYTPAKVAELPNVTENSERFILMVSADRWIKNCYRGLKAIDSLYSKGFLDGVKVHVYGNCPFLIKRKLNNPDRFVFFEYVSSSDLEKAYSQCEVFFYPTLNEGFGMPPCEAQKYGKTCVISAVASLPEIYSNSVIYCNPYDIGEMQNRILEALSNKIESKIIDNNFNRIAERQKSDLRKLALLIINRGIE